MKPLRLVHADPDGHRRVQAMLARYCTGRLTAAERSEVDAHLAGCPRCRAELDAERRLHGPPPLPRRALPWWSWALGAQALAIVLLAGALLLQWLHAGRHQALGAVPQAGVAEGLPVLVMFRPGTTEAELRDALLASGARVTSAPTPTGAWRVALHDADALARLRAHAAVALAEPLGTAP